MKAMAKAKYNARKARCQHGHLHDSKKEARRCDELYQMQERGLIQALENQVRIQLLPAQGYTEADPRMENERSLCYIADFRYIENSSGCVILEDVKGMKTDAYKIKRKLVKWMFCRRGDVVFVES